MKMKIIKESLKLIGKKYKFIFITGLFFIFGIYLSKNINNVNQNNLFRKI